MKGLGCCIAILQCILYVARVFTYNEKKYFALMFKKKGPCKVNRQLAQAVFSPLWVASPTVWHCLVWQMTDLFIWSAASHYGCLLPGRHVPPCVMFPGTLIKCLMAKNRGQATLSLRLVVLANRFVICRWKEGVGKKMEGQLESNKSLFVSLARTFYQLICISLLRWGNFPRHLCLFWLHLKDETKMHDDETK